MAFRHHSFKPLSFPPSVCKVEKQVSQFDSDGVERVSNVLVDSVPLPIPKPSEYTINFCMTAGQLNPVNLDDFTLGASASEVLSSSFDVPSEPSNVEPSNVEPSNNE